MSLSTRRPPGIPSSVRPPRSASTTRGREPQGAYDPPSDEYRTSSLSQAQRSRSVPRPSQGSDNPFRSRHARDAPPVPSTPSRQSSVSSASSGSSALSATSTTPSSIWDYVGWKTGTTTPLSEHEERVASPEPINSDEAQADSGGTIWSRVAAVTGGLSINVAKAWEAADNLPEPDTPPGRDSRVTTALKKHYIKQVSDPRQLPAWLFSDIERQAGRSYSRTEPASESNQNQERRTEPPGSARLRARHDNAYIQPQPVTGRDRMRTATYDQEYTGPTRAATRLKALRDAKRGPVDREVYVPPARATAPEPEPEPVAAAPPPRPRVGLPGRPVRPRRE